MKETQPVLRRVLPTLVLVAMTALAYGPVMRAGFVWDDDSHIDQNLTLRTAGGLHDIWLRPGATLQHYPLTFTVWWACYHLWGAHPTGYHVITLVLHIAVSLALWRVLLRLEVPGAWLGAMLFALHPVNVMSVAWATELKNTLSGLLALGSCWSYLRFTEAAPRRWGFYATSLVLFVLALLAKTAVGFLPATLLLIAWWKQDRVRMRDVLAVAPMVICALATGFITLYVEHHSGGAVGPQFAIPYVERVLISGRSFWFYLGKLCVPYPLIFIYERFTIDAKDAAQWLYPAATAALLVGLYALRHRIGKGAFVAAAHFYLGTSALIFVVVTYMTRFTFVADHWQYFGAMSAAALGGVGAFRLVSRATGAGRVAAVAVVALGLTTLGAATRHQTADYRDAETLYRATLARNPRCWMACYNLAAIMTRTGRNGEAMALLEEALRLRPNYGEAHLNLGIALATAGQPDAAIEQFTEAMRAVPELGAKAQFNIGNVLTGTGRIDAAVGHYEDALRLDRTAADVHNNLANALFRLGRFPEAIGHYQQALRIKPDLAEARTNVRRMCLTLAAGEPSAEAIDCFRNALELDPGSADAHNDLGVALARAKRVPEAREQFQEAVRIQPDFEEARDNLERAETSLGRR